MIITIWMPEDLLSVSVAVTPRWQDMFMLLVGLNLISGYQLYKTGTNSSIFGYTSCTYRVLMPKVSLSLCSVKQLGSMLHLQCDLPCYLLLAKAQFLAKSPPSLLIIITRVFRSDKLGKSELCLSATIFN